jgi:PAS domain S-box-containing protein
MPSPLDHEEQQFECAPTPFLEVNAAGWLLRPNRAACNLFGFSRNEWQTLQFFDLLAPLDAETTVRYFAEMLHGARLHQPFERQFKTRHGAILKTEIQPTPLLSPHGVPRGFRLAIIDLTPR